MGELPKRVPDVAAACRLTSYKPAIPRSDRIITVLRPYVGHDGCRLQRGPALARGYPYGLGTSGLGRNGWQATRRNSEVEWDAHRRVSECERVARAEVG
eukprot:365959-Chlamydomonas_euryale.AAC.4